jgi:putative DNA primase/helicase
MDFYDFATSHGLVIEHLTPGRWIRCRTVDKPRKRNGAYFYDHEYGHVQNWATMDHAETWIAERAARTAPDYLEMQRRIAISKARASEERRRKRELARTTGDFMFHTAIKGTHPYLIAKGFPDELGAVLPGGELMIPMFSYGLVFEGAQIISQVDGAWEKKMLFGMRAKGASFTIGAPWAPECWLVEGYATGLSVFAALRQRMNVNASVEVCFSANNLTTIGNRAPRVWRRLIFADNDESGAGKAAALATGLPFCMADEVGFDANDLHQKRGLGAVVKKIMEARAL